jgi:transposase-like protein
MSTGSSEYDDLEPPGGDPPDGGPRAVLSGDILPYIDGMNADGTRRRGYNAFVDPETVQQVVYERAKGRTLRSIAKEYGISPDTVSKWYKGQIRERANNPEAAASARARLTIELEALRNEVWRMQRDAPDDLKVQRETWVRIESVVRTLADLNGWKTPTTVRVDAHHTHQTQEDLELQEMINAAKAKHAAAVAAVETDFRQGPQGGGR